MSWVPFGDNNDDEEDKDDDSGGWRGLTGDADTSVIQGGLTGDDDTNIVDDPGDAGANLQQTAAQATGVRQYRQTDQFADLNEEYRQSGSNFMGDLNRLNVGAQAATDLVLDNPNASVQEGVQTGMVEAFNLGDRISGGQGNADDEEVARAFQDATSNFGQAVNDAVEGTPADNPATDLAVDVATEPVLGAFTGVTGVDPETGSTEGTVGAAELFDIGVGVATAGAGTAATRGISGAVRGSDEAASLTSRLSGGSDEAAGTDNALDVFGVSDESASTADDAAATVDETAEVTVVDEATEIEDDVIDIGPAGATSGRLAQFLDDTVPALDEGAAASDEAASGAGDALATAGEDALAPLDDAAGVADETAAAADDVTGAADDFLGGVGLFGDEAASAADEAASAADDVAGATDESSNFGNQIRDRLGRSSDEAASVADDVTGAADDFLGGVGLFGDEAASAADEAASAADRVAGATDEAVASVVDDIATGGDEAASAADDVATGSDEVAAVTDESSNFGNRIRDRLGRSSDEAASAADDAADGSGGFLSGLLGSNRRLLAGAGLFLGGGAAASALQDASDPRDAPKEFETAEGERLVAYKNYEPTEEYPNGGRLYAVTRDFQNIGYWLLLGQNGRTLIVLDQNGEPREAKINAEQFSQMTQQEQESEVAG